MELLPIINRKSYTSYHTVPLMTTLSDFQGCFSSWVSRNEGTSLVLTQSYLKLETSLAFRLFHWSKIAFNWLWPSQIVDHTKCSTLSTLQHLKVTVGNRNDNFRDYCCQPSYSLNYLSTTVKWHRAPRRFYAIDELLAVTAYWYRHLYLTKYY